MSSFYAVGVYTETLGRIVTLTVFADDAAGARARVEIEGISGHGPEDGETIEYVSRLDMPERFYANERVSRPAPDGAAHDHSERTLDGYCAHCSQTDDNEGES
jgi:hypothetical protein